MKKLLLTLLLLAFTFSALGQVYHEADISRTNMALNTTVHLECDSKCPVNRWSLKWQIPENSEILHIKDSIGRITSYTRTGEEVRIKTNYGPKRMNETVKIVLNVASDSKEIYRGLFKRELSLPGFEGEETRGKVHVDNLISGWSSYGFQTSYQNNTMKFKGEGPVSLRVKFGDGNETSYYSFFGEHPDNVSQAYEIAIGTTGLQQGFKRFPVASMPPEVYNRTANSWSAGEYIAGSMMISNNLGAGYIPILAHETVHGLNERELNWDRTSSNYFEEGTAEYVEFLVRKKISALNGSLRPPAELFGDDIRWDPDPFDRTYSIISSEGNQDRLWNYYRRDRDFMKTWSSMKPGHRDFGYAYSELIIRNYVKEGGNLSGLYNVLNVSREVKSPRVKWDLYSRYMDMTPCNYSSRKKFNQCLEEINEYDYPVYTARPGNVSNNFTVKELEIPERKEATGTGLLTNLKSKIRQMLAYIENFLEEALNRS